MPGKSKLTWTSMQGIYKKVDAFVKHYDDNNKYHCSRYNMAMHIKTYIDKGKYQNAMDLYRGLELKNNFFKFK